jgi:hypothetical protein
MRKREARLRKVHSVQEQLWKAETARVMTLEAKIRDLDQVIRDLVERLESGGLSATLFVDLLFRRFDRTRAERYEVMRELEARREAARLHGRRLKILERLKEEAGAAAREADAARALKEITETYLGPTAVKPGSARHTKTL